MVTTVKRTLFILMLLGAIISLGACTQKVRVIVDQHKLLSAHGELSPKTDPTYTPRQRLLQYRSKLESQLSHQSVQVIQVGDEVRIVLPVDRIFVSGSPKMFESAYPILDLVVKYMRTFHKVGVEVANYTDNNCSIQRNFALSQARSKNIAEYFWEVDVNARVIQARGFSHCEPISDNASAKGIQANQRAEVSFKEIFD
jgi:outer membrane protein OmpA-like peptidoglycan-associated protein